MLEIGDYGIPLALIMLEIDVANLDKAPKDDHKLRHRAGNSDQAIVHLVLV